MERQEFSDLFDVLYNNIMSNLAPGLDEYEKSVFLTKAQDELIKNYFNPKGNKYQEGFDDNQKRQIDFSNLLITTNIEISTAPKLVRKESLGGVNITYPTSPRVFLIINEEAITSDNNTLLVIPLKYDEYLRLCSKPYKLPLKHLAWRIMTDSTSADIVLGHNNSFSSYKIRYIKRPAPIILDSFSGTGLTIEGKDTPNEPVCELNPELHSEILQRAVELAKAAYTGDLNSTVEMGKRSE